MLPYKNIEQAEHVDSSLSTEMANALDLWYQLYTDQAPWLDEEAGVYSMNLPAFISSELARQIVLEMKWNITGKDKSGQTQDENGTDIMNPRAQYLKDEFEKLTTVLRQKLEQGCAAGGMIVKPYVNQEDKHIYFDWTMDWSFCPVAFDDDGRLLDVIIPDSFRDGKTTYTRLERHIVEGPNVRVTQKIYRSDSPDALGTEIQLDENGNNEGNGIPERWKNLRPELVVNNVDGPLFGWFKVAAANSVDTESPMGASVFAKAVSTIKQADMQYSRMIWEYEGSELAIDVDPAAFVYQRNADGSQEGSTPKLKERLFRAVDVDKGDRDLYEPFSPAIRDASEINGLNQIEMKVENLCGLSRGTIADINSVERTATELKINKQRSYATVADNQKSLELCLKDVIRVMDKYATLYGLAPEGDYDVSFDWDDSIITDTDQQMNERMMLYNAGMIGKTEMREWYFGETKAQAQDAIDRITEETVKQQEALMPQLGTAPVGGPQNGQEQGESLADEE